MLYVIHLFVGISCVTRVLRFHGDVLKSFLRHPPAVRAMSGRVTWYGEVLHRLYLPSRACWSRVVLRLEAIVQVIRWRRFVHRLRQYQ